MRKSPFGLAIVVAALSIAPAAARDANTQLEKPIKTVHVPLPPDKDNPDSKREVRCHYYAHFVVKEIDSGEVDADQLSILPAKEDRPCRETNAPDEHIVSSKDWSGYFDGARGDYIFFTAGDGWNGGLGFAVFTADAKKLFEDVAETWSAVRTGPGGKLELRYRRVFGAKCSLGGKDADTCWKAIGNLTGLKSPMPDCKTLYVKEQQRTPKFAKEVLADPAAIYYAASTTIDARGAHVSAVAGREVTCAPQE